MHLDFKSHTLFGCGVTVLQNMASLSKILVVLHHWIPGSTNHYTVVMAEKVNHNNNKLRICIINDCDNNVGES